jgi:type II secretory pathway component PulJ
MTKRVNPYDLEAVHTAKRGKSHGRPVETPPPSAPTTTLECAHGHTTRKVGCVSCVIVFDYQKHAAPIQSAPTPETLPTRLRLMADDPSKRTGEMAHVMRQSADEIERLAATVARLTARENIVGTCEACKQPVAQCHQTIENRPDSPMWHFWCYITKQKVRAEQAEARATAAETDRDSWRRVAERLETEKQAVSGPSETPASAAITPDIHRCEGRYPVPHKRDESFEVTYRCGLTQGHSGQHGPIETRPTQEEIEVVHRSFMERPAGRSRLVAHVPDANCRKVGAHKQSECGRPSDTPATE